MMRPITEGVFTMKLLNVLRLFVFGVALVLAVTACGMEAAEGPAGPPGPQGEPGAQGPAGAPGTPGLSLQETRKCEGVLVDAYGVQHTVTHEVYSFSDGSMITTCSSGNGGFQMFGFAMHRIDQPGARLASCGVQIDVDTGSHGTFRFTSTSPESGRVVYDDPNSTSHNRTTPLTCQSV